MELNRDAWYVRFAFWDEEPPARTSLCALFWRIVFCVGWTLIVLVTAFSHAVRVYEANTPIAFLVSLAYPGLLTYFWSERYAAAKWVFRCSLAVIGGSFLALVVAAIWADWGWGLLWLILGSLAWAALVVVLVIAGIFGCIHLTDRLSQSESSVVAMLRGIKQKVCPLVELKQK